MNWALCHGRAVRQARLAAWRFGYPLCLQREFDARFRVREIADVLVGINGAFLGVQSKGDENQQCYA